MKQFFLVFTAFCITGLARADITLKTKPMVDRAAYVTGFRLRADAAGFNVSFSGEDTALPEESAELVSLTLTTRDAPPDSGINKEPLFLKVYEDTTRTKLLGASDNALSWSIDAGAPLKTEQTYVFKNTIIPVKKHVVFVFETKADEVSPIGEAGFGFCETKSSTDFTALKETNLQAFSARTPALTLTLRPANALNAMTGPVPLKFIILGGVALMGVVAVATVALKKRSHKSAALPPPPGQ